MNKVLFVCTGNICRSPSAQGVFQHMIDEAGLADVISVDSAATHNFHVGESPDPRAQAAARKRGYDLSAHVGRQIASQDFREFDLILAMDWDNLALAQDLCPPAHAHKLRRMTEFCLQFDSPVVPDPYYGGSQGFEEVLDLVEDACEGLLRHVQRQLQAQVPPVQH